MPVRMDEVFSNLGDSVTVVFAWTPTAQPSYGGSRFPRLVSDLADDTCLLYELALLIKCECYQLDDRYYFFAVAGRLGSLLGCVIGFLDLGHRLAPLAWIKAGLGDSKRPDRPLSYHARSGTAVRPSAMASTAWSILGPCLVIRADLILLFS